MTELTIPPDVEGQEAAELVRDHVAVGDTVEVREADRTGSDDPETTGTVTGVEPGYLELDEESLDGKSLRYDEMQTIVRVESASKSE